MKIFALVTLFYGFFSTALASQNRELLDKALNNISSQKNVHLAFSKTVNQKLFNKTKTETGDLYLSQKKFKLVINSKPNQKVVFDGRVLWILQGEKSDLQVIKSKQNRTKKIPILSLFQNKSQTSNINLLNTTQKDQVTRYEVLLNEPSFNQKVFISVDNVTSLLKEVMYTDEADNEVTYVINQIKNELKLGEKFFSFTPPKNVKVITE